MPRYGARAAGKPVVPKVGIGTGAGANTNIAVAGIKPGDVLETVLRVAGPGSADAAGLSDVTAQTTIQSAGNIRVSAVTTGYQLLVHYLSR